MKYNHIQRLISAAMLIAFTVPSTIAYSNNNSSASTTSLSAEVRLTQANEKITLSLRDSDVKQVLRMFADKAGKNIVFHSSVSGRITLDMVDMPINEAFSLVLQISGLNYYEQDNTIIVLAKGNADNASFSKQEMMVFPVQYVSAAKIANFLNKNVFGIQKAGVSGVDAATVNAATNEIIVFGMPSDAAIVKKVIAQLDKEPLAKTYTVNHTTPAEMADMICNMLLPAHGAGSTNSSNGSRSPIQSGRSSGYMGGAAGIVTGGASSSSGSMGSSSSGGSSDSSVSDIKLGEGVVACTISQSSSGGPSSFDMQNIAISYYTQRGAIMMIGGSEAQQKMVERFIASNDVKQPQAYLELSIVELNEQGSKEFQNNWSIQSKAWGVSFNNGVTSGGRSGGPVSEFLTIPYKATSVDADTGKVTYSLENDYKTRQQLIGNGTYISWQMNYLIENKKARVLANPKILITNGQESVIDLTEDYVEKVTSEFLSSTSAGIGGSSGAVQRTYTIGDDKGIKISLVPFISPDGYVTMNIKPAYVTEAGKEYTNNESGGKDLAATLMNRRNLDLKNVRIKDGETLVIGGMIQESEQKIVQKIPVLGDIPWIGAAFRSTNTAKGKSELVIMITPKIIKDGEDAVADRL